MSAFMDDRDEYNRIFQANVHSHPNARDQRKARQEPPPEAPQRGIHVGKLVVRSVTDAANAPPRGYYLKGMISPGELSLWWGEGGVGKTFLLLFVAYMLALGRSVFGRRVKPVRVLYLGLEGETGIEQRIEALRRVYGDTNNFIYIAQPVNMFSDAEAVADLKDAIRQFGVGLIFIDTLNRAIGEGSESADSDMGRLRSTFDEIRYETGTHVAVVHHGGKDETRGPRGHSGLLYATDLTVKLSEGEGGARTAAVTRVKDGRSGDIYGYRLRGVELGTDDDGDPIRTCIAEETEAPAPKQSEEGANLNDEAKSLLRHITDALAEGLGRNDQPMPGMPLVPAISKRNLMPFLIQRGWLRLSERLSKDGTRSESVPDAEYTRLWKRLTALQIKGLIGFNRSDVWLAKSAQTP